MGGKNTRLKQIYNYELNEFARQSDLHFEDIKHLHVHFRAISSFETDDGVIDYTEFCQALKMERSLIAERFFDIFDLNHDSVLNFREFVLGISVLANNQESQIKLAFNIFDVGKKGNIFIEDFKEIMNSCLERVDSIEIPKNIVSLICEETFETTHQLCEDEDNTDKKYITFKQYNSFIRKNPHALKWLKVDFEQIKSGALLLLKNPKKYSKVYI